MLDELVLSATLLFAMRQKAANFGLLVTGLLTALRALRPNHLREILRVKKLRPAGIVFRDQAEKHDRTSAFSAYDARVGFPGYSFVTHGRCPLCVLLSA